MSTTTELHRKDAELQAVRAELVALREFWHTFWEDVTTVECACGLSAYEHEDASRLDVAQDKVATFYENRATSRSRVVNRNDGAVGDARKARESARQEAGDRCELAAESDALRLAEESFRHSWDMSDERMIDGAWVAGLCCECGDFVPYSQEVAHVAAAFVSLIDGAKAEAWDEGYDDRHMRGPAADLARANPYREAVR